MVANIQRSHNWCANVAVRHTDAYTRDGVAACGSSRCHSVCTLHWSGILRAHTTRVRLGVSSLSCSLVDAGHATPSGAVGMRSTGGTTAAKTGTFETTRRAGRHERVCTAVGATTPLPHRVLLSSHTTSTLNVVDACTHTLVTLPSSSPSYTG